MNDINRRSDVSAGVLQGKNRGFTLIEMLSVVLIVGMMIGITAGVAGAIASNRGNTTVQQVMALLDSARAKALTGRGDVAVMFVTDDSQHPGGAMAYRSMVICQKFSLEEGSDEQVFQPISEWLKLPEGYVLADCVPADSFAGVNFFRSRHVALPVRVNGKTVDIPGVVFSSLGEVISPVEPSGRNLLLAVGEGSVDKGSAVNQQGGDISADKCRWISIQLNSGSSRVMP